MGRWTGNSADVEAIIRYFMSGGDWIALPPHLYWLSYAHGRKLPGAPGKQTLFEQFDAVRGELRQRMHPEAFAILERHMDVQWPQNFDNLPWDDVQRIRDKFTGPPAPRQSTLTMEDYLRAGCTREQAEARMSVFDPTLPPIRCPVPGQPNGYDVDMAALYAEGAARGLPNPLDPNYGKHMAAKVKK